MEDAQIRNGHAGLNPAINEAALAALSAEDSAMRAEVDALVAGIVEDEPIEDPDVMEMVLADASKSKEQLRASEARLAEADAKLAEMAAAVEELKAIQAELLKLQAQPKPSVPAQGVFGPAAPAKAAGTKVTNRTYMVVAANYNRAGKVPQQQADIAEIFIKHFELGKAYTEAQVNEIFVEQAANYPSLAESVQPVLRLVRYYVDLHKSSGGFKENHASLVYRGLLKAS